MRHWKLILPPLEEARGKHWRSIKYSLFPPLGLATLAGYLPPDDHIEIVDGHVEEIRTDDRPDFVLIQTYITNSDTAYALADLYRRRGSRVILGGLHATSLPEEARLHADSLVLGPADGIMREVVLDAIQGKLKPLYQATVRDITDTPFPRRDLLARSRYFVPNSLVVSRGCPYGCDFCYKHAFFKGGSSYYTTNLDRALMEVDSLPGRHLFFLDDNLLAPGRFTEDLLSELAGRDRLIQGAGTIASVLDPKLVGLAARAGLKSLFVGFESIDETNLRESNKRHNRPSDYERAIAILHDHGIKINGSFVFGMDGDDKDIFRRTVDWAVEMGITTATFHIMTPYPATRLHDRLKSQGRILSEDWSRYDTRHAVFRPLRMSPQELEEGYRWSYREFYRLGNIARNASVQTRLSARLQNFAYAFGWKKMEPVWELVVRARKLASTMPFFERVLGGSRSP
ncbi:MAG TPA: radical SAM protein [Fibrobacteria bacterium]|nr:radical SAM protein [Fibrobacteria bacterium]